MAILGAPRVTPPPDGDRSRGFQFTAFYATLLAISTILLFARLFTRAIVVQIIGPDDVFIVMGFLFSVSSSIVNVYIVRNGIGRHIYYLLQNQNTLEQLSEAIKLEYTNQVILIFGTMSIKVSIGFFLLRIFGFGTKRWWKWVLYSIMAFAVLTSMSCALIVVTQCRPLPKLWNPSIHGSCWGPKTVIAVGNYNGAVSVFCDWVLASLPIVFMWKLQISVKLKAGICVLMGMGFFSGITAIIRTVALKGIASTDFTWNIIVLDFWAILELHLGIIAACIPTLKPLFNPSNRHRPSKKGWSRKLTDDSAQAHDENKHRLQNFALRKTLPTVPPSRYSYAGNSDRDHVGVFGGTTRYGLRVDSFESEGSRDEFGVAKEGNSKKTEFSLNTRNDDGARGWFRGYNELAEREAFDRV